MDSRDIKIVVSGDVCIRLKTVDRTEIKGYRSIKNLILSAKNSVRPLPIAVFGTPGSGKSFGVTKLLQVLLLSLCTLG